MPRAGLSRELLTAAAAEIIDTEGPGALSMARLAERFEVKVPSLYNHVDSLDALVRDVGLAALSDLTEPCREALMGRSGGPALHAFATAYRTWALAHPGTYPLTQVARPDDPEWDEASRRLLEPVLAVVAGGVPGEKGPIHAARALRSAIHGFVSLELTGGFGLDIPTEESFDRMVEILVTALPARRSGGV